MRRKKTSRVQLYSFKMNNICILIKFFFNEGEVIDVILRIFNEGIRPAVTVVSLKREDQQFTYILISLKILFILYV